MSAVADDAPPTIPVPTVPARRVRPGLAAAVRVELAKLTAQWPLRIVIALCVLVPVAFAVVMRAASTMPADTLFGRWAGTTGFATSLTVLNWAASYGAPLLAGVFAGDIFASEDRLGTWKTILTRSSTRTQLFLGKAVAATLSVWISFAMIGVSSLMAGLAVVGAGPLVGLSGQAIGSGSAFGLVAASWALSLVWITPFVAVALLLSIASRSGIIGVLGPVLLALVLQLLSTVGSGQIVRSVLPSTPLDAWHELLTDPLRTGPVLQGVLTSVGYTAVFACAAWYLLRRRDFVGIDAAPANRRPAAVRISVAVAAITVVLLALSGVGGTALTARRLNTSIAATFGNLAEVRYEWLTGSPADTTIPWQANCNRGGTPTGVGVSNSSGAGDDWSCTITDTRPSDGAGVTILDLTLKPNGCYQVQSSPGAVGALYVNDDHGKPFINPLYAFDGCLGTS
jgi:ABC-2 type transport system permease protein